MIMINYDYINNDWNRLLLSLHIKVIIITIMITMYITEIWLSEEK